MSEGGGNADGDIQAEQFMVAADMTLYSNPVNKALHISKEEAKTAPQKAAKKQEDHGEDDDDVMIASDMTKYDSPLTQLEKEQFDRESHKDDEKKNDKNKGD